jgi:transposase
MEVFMPPDVRPKRPHGRRSKHSESFQLMVAKKVVDERMSYRDAAKSFGMSHGSISNVVKKYKGHKFNSKRKLTSNKYKAEVENYRHKTQVNDLKLEIAELYLENLLLKKMCEHYQQKRSEDSSDITSKNLDLLPGRAK